MSVTRLAIVGCGLRAENYLSQMGSAEEAGYRVVALADPNPKAIELYCRRYGITDPRVFDTGPKLLDAVGDQLDAIIIASPNALHCETMVPAAALGLNMLLEKPVGTTAKDCAAMWSAWEDADRPPVTVGFVLRYAPFYQRVKQLIAEGVLGQVLSIEATEELGPTLTSLFMRDWRRFEHLAGPMLLEKCAHDMDLLAWLAESSPRWVNSFARRTRFVPRADAAERCRDCALTHDCRYSPENVELYVIESGQREALAAIEGGGTNDLCVYNSIKDTPDHQVVNIEFDNGILASFSVTLDQPINTRTLKINGTDAQVVGDIRRNRMSVIHHAKTRHQRVRVEDIAIDRDDSGHDGADSGLARHFLSLMRGRPTGPWPGLREGIEACLTAFAAEQSCLSRQSVDVQTLRHRVYDRQQADLHDITRSARVVEQRV